MEASELTDEQLLQIVGGGSAASKLSDEELLSLLDAQGVSTAPDSTGGALPSEELTFRDHAKNAATALGNEFADVRDFLLDVAAGGIQAENMANYQIPAETRELIDRGFTSVRQDIQDRSMRRLRETEVAKAESPVAGTLGQIAGEIASVPVGGPTRTVGQRIVSSGVQGALSGVVEPAADGSERLRNAAVGGGLGTVGGSVIEGVAAPIRRGINARNGELNITEGQREVLEAGERENVPVFYDDLAEGGAARRLGTINERVPFVGGSGGRLDQNAAQRSAVTGRVESLKDEVRSLGGDPNEIFDTLQEGLQDRLSRVQRESSRRFRAVAQKLDSGGTFLPKRSLDYVTEALAREQARGSLANQGLVDALNRLKDSPQMGQGGTFTEVKDLRKFIADEISSFYTGADVNVGSRGVEVLQGLKRAIERDMEEQAFRVDRVAWRQFRDANKFYQENIVPFKERGLRELVRSNEPERAYRWLFASGVPESRAKRMYSNLTPKGRASVRLGMVLDAFEKAGGDEAQSFSAAKFATELEKRDNVIGTFFRGTERREIEGLVKLMRATQRAGQVAENPPTGQRLVDFALAGTAVANLPAAATIGSGSALLTGLFQSGTGRNLLLAVGRSRPGTQAYDQAVARLQSYVARTSARSASSSTRPEQE